MLAGLQQPILLKLGKHRQIITQKCINPEKQTFTPGNDGLPIEFYKTFWPTVGKILVQVLNEAYNAKEMLNSRKQAVRTLIGKKDKDRTFLENWRPISLINVDSKIASKVITMRIIKVLPEIIHCNQTGYVI